MNRQQMDTNEHEPGSWLTRGRFSLLLAALIFVSFPQVLLGLQTFLVRDFGFFAYPLAYYQRECFWHGKLPLWNPYNNCGLPFLAQWNTMCLYPPALIYLLLPLQWSLGFFCLLHLFFAGLGMYFLAHRWTGDRLAAALAGLVFAFNGFTLNMLMWPSHIATLSWMPWVVLCMQRAWQIGGRMIFVAALLGALQMLAGGPETILFTWVILLALWLTEMRVGQTGRTQLTLHAPRFTVFWRFPLIVLLVAGLAAAQLLPFLDLAAHSQRESGYADARWSMPGWGWANFLVPMAFGYVSNLGVFFQYEQSWTSSYYLGVLPLLLAILAIWSWRSNPVVRLLGIGVVIAFILALGDQTRPGHWLRQAIPFLSVMTYPIKYVAVIVFAVPLLAAAGLAGQRAEGRGQRPVVSLPAVALAKEGGQWSVVGGQWTGGRLVWVGGMLLFLIGVILVWAGAAPFPTDNFRDTLHNGVSRAAFLLGAVGLLLAAHAPGKVAPDRNAIGSVRVRRVFIPMALLLLCWLDVWTHEPNQNPTVAADVYEPGLARGALAMNPQPEAGQSRAMLSPSAESQFMKFIAKDQKVNLLAKRAGYFADCNLLDHVPKVNGFFSLYPRECGELASILYGSTNANYPRLEDFMGVSQITARGELSKWQARDSFLPLATAGQRPVFLDDTNAVRALLARDFDARKVVLLPPQQSRDREGAPSAQALVQLERFTPEELDLKVEAPEPSIVVLSQTWYHNWRAFVDGTPATLLRANYAFQAVEVPNGTHHLRIIYQDRALQVGGIISVLTLIGCGLGLANRREPG